MTKILYSLKSVHKILQEDKPSKVCIVTSRKLQKQLGWAIKELGVTRNQIILLPDGEKAKEWRELEKLLKRFSEHGLDRDSIVIALGGGSVGDTTGFAAAIYLRGIKYIQVPTTLLAQVDSAHGGKTGINFLKHKNQIGSFYPPAATVIDTRLLKSLSREQFVDGLGEIIKAGLIRDPGILYLLKKEHLSTLVRSSVLLTVIKKSIAVKQYYIDKDFKDNNARQLLNVGHTFGHAIELKYKITHGYAVIIGILQELAFTESLGFTSSVVKADLLNLLGGLGIVVNTTMKGDWPVILRDKKIRGNKISFPVIEKAGKAKLVLLDIKTLRGH